MKILTTATAVAHVIKSYFNYLIYAPLDVRLFVSQIPILAAC